MSSPPTTTPQVVAPLPQQPQVATQAVVHTPPMPPPPQAARFGVPNVDSTKQFQQFKEDYAKYLDYSRLSDQEARPNYR